MKASDFFRCAIVSLLLAFFAPAVTMEISGPEEGERVVDLSALSEEQFDNASEEEFKLLLANAPHKEIDSAEEEFFYPFTHPQILYFYLQGSLYHFPFLFLASICASFWNRKAIR